LDADLQLIKARLLDRLAHGVTDVTAHRGKSIEVRLR
jgi:hypothetical protein